MKRVEDLFVTSERIHTKEGSSKCTYDIAYMGNYNIRELTTKDVIKLIACLQNALQANGEEGAENE